MNTTTILDLIAAREAAASAALDDLREQQAKLAAEVAGIECELADLATTRQTLTKILENEVTASEPAIISEPYQQILAVFTPDRSALRAKDVCLALGIGTEPKDTEGIRAKLKRLVNRHILTETQPGLFTLTPERA
ncbi:hypothetical protein [Jidongwangia harbinensis]|uniref:hypothetical protein n=1 Tax=Jidongwangia harbinensis TaxID=2878561 RepID=UPI001CD9D366|nr:hypothetical protein [Jidongwangia harbinensis]MCA2216253.1 hypothetical protein [Jidongwangia harbinensis]MCA2216255.1 hypothetical protein [Jidongwangia harbinensis]MCA2216990.1 hypothetical protein [Jidongwangia harbinensis]